LDFGSSRSGETRQPIAGNFECAGVNSANRRSFPIAPVCYREPAVPAPSQGEPANARRRHRGVHTDWTGIHAPRILSFAAGSGYDGASSGGANLGPNNPTLMNGAAGFAGIRRLAKEFRQRNGLAPDASVPMDAVTRFRERPGPAHQSRQRNLTNSARSTRTGPERGSCSPTRHRSHRGAATRIPGQRSRIGSQTEPGFGSIAKFHDAAGLALKLRTG